ncbi:uncharacterized protein LOC142551587 isoform X1 [Primulina tabacum]|uniref:uncharacterized protein LOC142551587 isoform X1 n=1 Tax=Primulina tabacum TaxID=48773 RepID=UPI003F59F775
MPQFAASLIPSVPPAVHPPRKPLNPPSLGQLPRPSLEAEPISRRDAAILFSCIIGPVLPYFVQPPPASAFSFGISGPKEWLKEQKKKSSKFLLAPVDASRNFLRSAYLLLTEREAEFSKNDLEEVQKLLVSAARDCVPQDRNSFVVFQSKTGVEVCTFQLILNNASSLLDDKDPSKLKAEAKLSDLIQSFTSLSGMTREGDVPLTTIRQRVVVALKDTINSLNSFEQGIKNCLEV